MLHSRGTSHTCDNTMASNYDFSKLEIPSTSKRPLFSSSNENSEMKKGRYDVPGNPPNTSSTRASRVSANPVSNQMSINAYTDSSITVLDSVAISKCLTSTNLHDAALQIRNPISGQMEYVNLQNVFQKFKIDGFKGILLYEKNMQKMCVREKQFIEIKRRLANRYVIAQLNLYQIVSNTKPRSKNVRTGTYACTLCAEETQILSHEICTSYNSIRTYSIAQKKEISQYEMLKYEQRHFPNRALNYTLNNMSKLFKIGYNYKTDEIENCLHILNHYMKKCLNVDLTQDIRNGYWLHILLHLVKCQSKNTLEGICSKHSFDAFVNDMAPRKKTLFIDVSQKSCVSDIIQLTKSAVKILSIHDESETPYSSTSTQQIVFHVGFAKNILYMSNFDCGPRLSTNIAKYVFECKNHSIRLLSTYPMLFQCDKTSKSQNLYGCVHIM